MTIEPFNYQKRTNIEEHNQIVDKLNEVVDAVNNIDPSGQGLEPRVSALETDVTEIGNRVDATERTNLEQDSAIATLGQRVGATEDNVTGLTGRVGQLETDTTNLDGRVTDIDGRLTTLAGNYTTLGGRVDSINSEVGQLSTEVGGLETGKVNKDQGVANAGKVLGIGDDGQVVPVAQSGGGSSITVDSELNAESTNPVENKAVTSALSEKLGVRGFTAKRLFVSDSNGLIIEGKIKTIAHSISFSKLTPTMTIDNVEYNVYSFNTSLAGGIVGPFNASRIEVRINDIRYEALYWYFYDEQLTTPYLPNSMKFQYMLEMDNNRVVGNLLIPVSFEVTSISGIIDLEAIYTS